MKKSYEQPEMEVVDFRVEEIATLTESDTGAGTGPLP